MKINEMSHLQKNTAVSVHVGPGVLRLPLFQQDIGHNLVKLGNQFKHGVIGQMFQGKLALTSVTRVGLSQDSMAIARHHLQWGKRKDDLVIWGTFCGLQLNVWKYFLNSRQQMRPELAFKHKCILEVWESSYPSRFEGVPDVVPHPFIRNLPAQLLLQGGQPHQHLLSTQNHTGSRDAWGILIMTDLH